MKKINFLIGFLAIALSLILVSSCNNDYDADFLIGRWKLINDEYGFTHTHLEFKKDGTFEYTSIIELDYKEIGKYRVEGKKLYQMYSDEDDWIISLIGELDNDNIILYEDYEEDGSYETYCTYRRIK